MRNLDLDEMLIVACDGLWDVFSNEQAINDVRDIFAEGESDVTLVAEEMLDQSLMKGSKDNVTAIVVKLSSIVSVGGGGGGGGVAARRQLREQESSSS